MSDRVLADAARDYVHARLAMSEDKESQLEMICKLDAAWEQLVLAYDDDAEAAVETVADIATIDTNTAG